MDKITPTELVVDDTIEPPAPLDPAIASLYLKTRSNRLTDGYDLSVSAFFGSERVQLVGGDFSVNVEISIDRAQIDLDFIRCRPSLIELTVDQVSDERRIEQKLKATRHHAGRGKFLLKGSTSTVRGASGAAEFEVEAGRSMASNVEVSRTRTNWKRISPKTIIVGTVVGDLEGMELDDFVGWRVIPNTSSETSGVVAVLSVREDWINFIKIHNESFVGKIGQRAKNLFETNDRKRQHLFALLLRHLSATGLSQSTNPNQAVLAVHPFIVKPDLNHATTVLAPASDGRISLDSKKIDQFLVSAPGIEIETLVSLGVPHTAIRESSVPQERNSRKSGLFTALSSPLNALKAYEFIVDRKSMPRLEMEHLVTKRVATDLVNLELVTARNHHLFIVDEAVTDPEGMLRYATAKADSIITARAILVADPFASGEEISEMLITKFGKTYTSQASKLRVGNALKRWARWLEPHLVDPKGGVEAASLKQSALSKTPAVGRRSYATPENIEIAREGFRSGLKAKKIAENIGVSAETVRNWKRLGMLD